MDTIKIQAYKLISKNAYIISLFLIGLLFLTPILYPGFYISQDGEAHVARFAAYFKAFSDGQFPARWAGNLNYGYGSPLFIFFYPLPGYLASFIHFFGISYEASYKLLISSSFILGPIFLFLWLSSRAKKEIAFATSIIYLLLPYRLLDTFVRGDIAEMISFVFVPLIFLFIDRAQEEENIKPIVFGSLAYGLFILSHNGMAAIFSPVFLVYSIIIAKNKKDFIRSVSIFILGLLISCFFWLPATIEGKFVYEKLVVDTLYKANFVPLFNLFYSSWGFGPDINLKGGLSPQIGVLYASIPILTIFFIRKFKEKKEIIFWMIVFFGAAFMTTGYSEFLWKQLPVIRQMGYPWRFAALSGFASCMVIFFVINHFKNRSLLITLIFLFVISSIPFIKVKGYATHTDYFYNSYQGTTDYHLRTSSIWTAGDFWKKPKSELEIIGGQGHIKNFSKKSNLHKFIADAKTQMSILDNTVYFPGWKVKIDNRRVPIQFQDMNHRGLITFGIPKGSHMVRVVFEESPVRFVADYISLFGLFLLLLLFCLRSRINRILKR